MRVYELILWYCKYCIVWSNRRKWAVCTQFLHSKWLENRLFERFLIFRDSFWVRQNTKTPFRCTIQKHLLSLEYYILANLVFPDSVSPEISIRGRTAIARYDRNYKISYSRLFSSQFVSLEISRYQDSEMSQFRGIEILNISIKRNSNIFSSTPKTVLNSPENNSKSEYRFRYVRDFLKYSIVLRYSKY